MIRGIIFDLDGTIADSNYVWREIDREFFAKHNMSVPQDYLKMINSASFEETASYTKNTYGFEESVEEIIKIWYDMAIDEYSNNVKLKPFAKEFIEKMKAKGIKIALATANSEILYESTLKNNGIFHLFDVFTEVSEVKKTKEFPDIYLKCAEKMGLQPDECVVFEDILRAVRGAKKAGMKTVAVYDESSYCDRDELKRESDFYINDFSQCSNIDIFK